MCQVAQGLFQLNSENLHKQRFYSVFRKPAAVPNQPPCKIFLTSNWNFSCFPRDLWEVRDFLFFSNLTLDDGGLQFSAPFTHLFYTNSISLTLHTGYMLLPSPQPPQGSLYRGGFSCPREPRKLCIVTPDFSQKHLSREQGPSLTCWQPRCAWPFPVPWHVAGLALLVATGTFRCCSAELLCSHSKAPARSAPDAQLWICRSWTCRGSFVSTCFSKLFEKWGMTTLISYC